MSAEQKSCQNCKTQFTIEPEDFGFYEKLKVPPPTWCPDCRLQRRLLWRNERILYRRPCNAPGHSEILLSIFPADAAHPVYDQEYWWSDQWDGTDYGQNYDFSKPFFVQFKELLNRVPIANLLNLQLV